MLHGVLVGASLLKEIQTALSTVSDECVMAFWLRFSAAEMTEFRLV
jgi:hypothetical protein